MALFTIIYMYARSTKHTNMEPYFFFFFFNQHCNPCGLWPAQLSLSILSRRVFTECCCQRHVKPLQLGGPVIRKFQLPTPGIPHVWNDSSEPQQQKVELSARNCREFCRKWWLTRHFWVLLHAGFTSSPKEGALRIFSLEKSEGFGRVWTRELGYQRPARSPLDHRSRYVTILGCWLLYMSLFLDGINQLILSWEFIARRYVLH